MITAKEALERTKRSEILDAYGALSKEEIEVVSKIERIIYESAENGKLSCVVQSDLISQSIGEYLTKCGYNIVMVAITKRAMIDWNIH